MKSLRSRSGAIPRPRKWLTVDVTASSLKVWKDSTGFSGSLLDLVSMPTPEPEQFENPDLFRTAYWRAEVWSKFPFEIEGLDRDKAAYATFFEMEERCAASNRRYMTYGINPYLKGTGPSFAMLSLC